jgi:alkanesulfonate monooxygenase SsuD/methylene tetrahydromethanopterin reductase-like flavin-dependent oxidoreductase (luciferase family)
MRPVTFGLVLPAGSPTREGRATFVADLNRALSLVAGHFDSAWMIDHLQPDATDLLESFTTVSYLAALHPQFRFGQTVVCQSFRNPALLAKMGATLQFLSGGRFTLGLGAGWNAEEYRAYGYDFPPAQMRVAQAESIAGDLYSAQNQEDDFGFVGTPTQIVAQMRSFMALGVDSFLLDCGGFPKLTTLELLIHEVLPAFAEPATGEWRKE